MIIHSLSPAISDPFMYSQSLYDKYTCSRMSSWNLLAVYDNLYDCTELSKDQQSYVQKSFTNIVPRYVV